MSGEQLSDPYLAKRRDEEAFFSVWFELQRRDHWKKHYPDEPFHENWGMGYRDSMWQAWMARASLHVTVANQGGKHE